MDDPEGGHLYIITGSDSYNNWPLIRNGPPKPFSSIGPSIRYCVVVRAFKSIPGPLQIQILYRQEPGRSIPDKSPFSLKVFPLAADNPMWRLALSLRPG